MSDIPSYIFIRSNSNSGSLDGFEEATDADHQHQHDQEDDNEPLFSASQRDLMEMKRMIQDIGRDPQILRERCGIPPFQPQHNQPRLSNSMAVKYQQWAASQEEHQRQQGHEEEEEVEEFDDESLSHHHSYCYSHDGKLTSFRRRASYYSNTVASPATPPSTAKNKLALSSLPSTPQTQATTTLSPSMLGSLTSTSAPSKLPFDSYFCQECSSSSCTSSSTSLAGAMHRATSKQPIFRYSSGAPLTNTMPLDFPMVVAMARSA
jgi:hypothetical protein